MTAGVLFDRTGKPYDPENSTTAEYCLTEQANHTTEPELYDSTSLLFDRPSNLYD